MASKLPLASSVSTRDSAAATKLPRNCFITVGESTRLSTARVRACSGGSASRMMLCGRQAFSFAKSLRPTPRLEQKVRGSLRTAWTSAWRATP